MKTHVSLLKTILFLTLVLVGCQGSSDKETPPVELPQELFRDGDIAFRRGTGITSRVVLAADREGGILFAPHAFVPQRQLCPSKSLSPPVFLLISTHSTATLGIPLTSPTLKFTSFGSSTGVKPRDYASNLANRLRTLYAQSFRTTLATYVLPRLLARS